ncbi:MAG: ABC transporter ATP-binding protein, partial [Pseudooceanicola sp.]|nr:ABC transporter ATP-binding protein [Pseudooceanicola sp.]
HDMDFIGRLCDPVIVMAEGKVLAEGSAEHIMENEAVIEAYLGRGLKNKDMLAAAEATAEPAEGGPA